MYYVDGDKGFITEENKKEHEYPTYGRQFLAYKWYKPLLVILVFMFFYIILATALDIGVKLLTGYSNELNTLSDYYDTMDMTNIYQQITSLGGVAMMIPSLWIASKIVRDRPFSSYSSSRGGWNSKVFWKCMGYGILCVVLPNILVAIFVDHALDDFHNEFTVLSFIILTVLGPLQCIAEEYAFRGLLMQTLGSWTKVPIIAIIAQSLVFVLVHPYDNLGKVCIFISGTAFALAAWFGNGIEASSAMHVCNNMCAFYMQGLGLGTISSGTDMEEFCMTVFVAVAYVTAIVLATRKKKIFSRIRKDDREDPNRKYAEKMEKKAAKHQKKEA